MILMYKENAWINHILCEKTKQLSKIREHFGVDLKAIFPSRSVNKVNEWIPLSTIHTPTWPSSKPMWGFIYIRLSRYAQILCVKLYCALHLAGSV